MNTINFITSFISLSFCFNYLYYDLIIGEGAGYHSTEVAFVLLTQLFQVQFLCQLVKN